MTRVLKKYRYRRADTGQFCTARYAKRFPRRTVRETVKAMKTTYALPVSAWRKVYGAAR